MEVRQLSTALPAGAGVQRAKERLMACMTMLAVLLTLIVFPSERGLSVGAATGREEQG